MKAGLSGGGRRWGSGPPGFEALPLEQGEGKATVPIPSGQWPRQFLFGGLEMATVKWRLICTRHDQLTLFAVMGKSSNGFLKRLQLPGYFAETSRRS